MDTIQTAPNATAAAIRAVLMDGRATFHDFAAGIGKSEQTIRLYAKRGLPVEYIGRIPMVLIAPAIEWLRNQRQPIDTQPRRPGRPRK